MAQAPEGGASAPRQNKTVKQFSGMNTQNRRNAIPEGAFAWLENIQPIGPGNLHSIPGRSLSVVRIPPFVPPPPFGCPEDTLPTGAQNLSVIHCYDITGGVPDGTIGSNNAGQMNFVTGEPESFVAIVTNQSGFGVVYPLVTAYQAIEATGESLAGITALPLPDGRTAEFIGQSAGTGRNGHSDERSILHSLTNVTPPFMGNQTVMAYFNYDLNTVTFFLFAPGMFPGTWAKRGNRLWHLADPGFAALVRYDVSTGGAHVATANIAAIVADKDRVKSLQGTNNFLWMAYRGGGQSKIFKLHQDTMALIDTFDVVGVTPNILSTYVVNDDLIYIWNRDSAGVWGFYYFVPSASPAVPVLIDQVVASCTSDTFDQSGQLSMQFNKGFFYLSTGGFGIGTPNITKIGPLVCPGTDIPIGS